MKLPCECWSTSSGDSIHAEVVVVEPTGSQTELALHKSKHELAATFRKRLNVRPGETVHLKPGTEHLFDQTTDLRILADVEWRANFHEDCLADTDRAPV
uniref:hypothetical protein n=1 Tax=Pararhizobium sp. IMCC3301 TaxID=3067904 RepID=UPI002741D8EE|nr:hypothetical protein [Pararhizobium sp. IMCC3301]